MNKIEELESRIRELQSELQTEQAKLNSYKSLAPMQKLATDLHREFCCSNHIDECAWHYAAINDFTRSDKAVWLKHAKRVLIMLDNYHKSWALDIAAKRTSLE